MEGDNYKKVKFSDYLSILIKWKKFLILNLLIIGLITMGITFLIPKKYKADATIMIQEDNNMGLLNSVMSSSAGSLLGGALFGGGGTSMDKMFGYLESRSIFLDVIKKFKLIDYYGHTEYKREKTLKDLAGDAIFDLTGNGMIQISMVHESPDTAKAIVNYFIYALDSLNRAYTSQHSTNYRKFIEKRYLKNLKDIKNAEQKFKEYQEQYKVYVVPEQFQITFDAIAKLEGELVQKEFESDLLKLSNKEGSPKVKLAEQQVGLLKKKLNDLTNGKSTTTESLISYPFKKIPEVQIKYIRLRREIEIQNKLLEFILPLYEQALMEEQKDIPTIMVLDPPLVPEYKDSPKRAFIIVGVGFIAFFINILIVFMGEKAYKRKDLRNIFEEKETSAFRRIVKFYKIKVN